VTAFGRLGKHPRETMSGISGIDGISHPTAARAAVQATPVYSGTAIVSEEELASLETDWNRLSEASERPNVFMTFAWFRAWNRRLAQEDPRRHAYVLVLRQDREVVGVSPFVLRTSSRFGLSVRKIEFVGHQGDYHDLLLGRDVEGRMEALSRFLEQTSDEWDLVELTDLRAPEGGIARIEAALSGANLLHRTLPERQGCPYLPLDADSSTVMNRLSGHVRRTLRRRMERASAEGLRVRISEKPHEEPGLLAKLIRLERGKIEAGGPFIGMYPEVFESLFKTLGPAGWLRVALLEKDGEPVAFQLGFRCGTKLWDYSKAYDRSFARFAPGTMLVHGMITHGLSHGCEEYDFLRGEEPYKLVWSTACHRSFRLLIWNRRWASRARKLVYCDVKKAVYQLMGNRE